MSTTTTQSPTENQAAAASAREKIKVQGFKAEDVISAASEADESQGNGRSDAGRADPNNTPPVVDPAVMHAFKVGVQDIKSAGETFLARVETYAKATAVGDLGCMLGFVNKFFVGAPEKQVDSLKDEMWKHVDMRYNENTSVFNLTSRIYRSGKDKRKASADAKVLEAAVNAGVTQDEFADWLKRQGGYDAVVKRSSKTKKATPGPRAPKAPDPKDLWERAGEAVSALVHNGQYREVFTFEKNEWPDLYDKVCPKDRGYSRLVVVNSTGDDVHFHILESFRPFGARYEHKHPVNVDGTSANTWPEWMLAKPDDSTSNDDDSDDAE